MSNRLSFTAKEGSSYAVRLDFGIIASDGVNMVPVVPNNGLTWTLKDEQGNIVNDRNQVAITSAETIYIVLQGGDLALSSNYPEKRFLTVEGTYDSTLGDNLLLVDQVEFKIERIV